MLDCAQIEAAVSDCLVTAGTTFRQDQLKAYGNAIESEKNPNARWVLERILENAKAARMNRSPLCDDTGIPHVFIETGDGIALPAGWLPAVRRGIALGLKTMPGRPMAVKGDDIQRVEQSGGLSEDPADVLPAPIVIRETSGREFKITVLLLGGGPEIRARTYRVFHKRSVDVVLGEAAGWMASEMKSLGCTPGTVAIGIGRTHQEASALMLEAMKDGTLDVQNDLERKVTDLVNRTTVGPLGLGGGTTALGTFIKVGPIRASGVRIVSARPCCCFEPRKATVVLEGAG